MLSTMIVNIQQLRFNFLKEALLDPSLQSIHIEEQYFDVAQNSETDKYVTVPEPN